MEPLLSLKRWRTKSRACFEIQADFDVCTPVLLGVQYRDQPVRPAQQLIPASAGSADAERKCIRDLRLRADFGAEEILDGFGCSRSIKVQIFRRLLDNVCSENARKMSAMDNATRMPGEMIDTKLSMSYHTSGQGQITKELIETFLAT